MLALGSNGTQISATGLTVAEPTNPVWRTPYTIPIPADFNLTLYNSSQNTWAVNLLSAPPGVILLGRQQGDPSHYVLLQQDRYILWSFNGGPNSMNDAGKQLFVNVMRSLVP
jgi:hypothetical protein